MRKVNSRIIRTALEAELSHIEPSREIWGEVASALPQPQGVQHAARRRYPLMAALVIVLALSTTGIALAATPFGNEVVNWVMQKFGIQLVSNTSHVAQELNQKGGWTFVQGAPLAENMDKIPEGMKLPGYLPGSLKVPEARVSLYELNNGAGIRWTIGNDEKFVEVWFHNEAFGAGSTTITNGEATDIQQVKIGDLEAMAFHDGNGWNLDWAQDGHQYTIHTDYSLEEAAKVAESIK